MEIDAMEYERRLKKSDIDEAQTCFKQMLEPWHCDTFIILCGRVIRDLVTGGRATWEDLGFSDEDVKKRLQIGREQARN